MKERQRNRIRQMPFTSNGTHLSNGRYAINGDNSCRVNLSPYAQGRIGELNFLSMREFAIRLFASKAQKYGLEGNVIKEAGYAALTTLAVNCSLDRADELNATWNPEDPSLEAEYADYRKTGNLPVVEQYINEKLGEK